MDFTVKNLALYKESIFGGEKHSYLSSYVLKTRWYGLRADTGEIICCCFYEAIIQFQTFPSSGFRARIRKHESLFHIKILKI